MSITSENKIANKWEGLMAHKWQPGPRAPDRHQLPLPGCFVTVMHLMEQRFLLLTQMEQAASKVNQAMHGHGQREAANEHFSRQSWMGFSFPPSLSLHVFLLQENNLEQLHSQLRMGDLEPGRWAHSTSGASSTYHSIHGALQAPWHWCLLGYLKTEARQN